MTNRISLVMVLAITLAWAGISAGQGGQKPPTLSVASGVSADKQSVFVGHTVELGYYCGFGIQVEKLTAAYIPTRGTLPPSRPILERLPNNNPLKPSVAMLKNLNSPGTVEVTLACGPGLSGWGQKTSAKNYSRVITVLPSPTVGGTPEVQTTKALPTKK